jgi:DNA-binding ferritin-like protein (Dps family)
MTLSPGQKLPFYLRGVVALRAETGIDADEPLDPFVFPEDPDEETDIVFRLSQRQFTAILSAVDTGSIICYGADAMQVYWWFIRNLERQVAGCDLVATALLTCTDVQAALATLIATDPVIQDALRTFVTEDEAISDYFNEKIVGLTGPQIESKVIAPGCDNSTVAGAVVAIVERMNLINEDALEIIEVGTNDEEKVAAVIGAIPGFETLPFDDVIDFAQDLLEDFFENYSAAVTEEWKDDVEEDLYCLARENPDCSLTYEQLFQYFQNRAGSSLTIGSLILDVVNFVRTGDFDTDELVASGMYAIQLGLILAGKEFVGMNLVKMSALTRDALPSTKWEEWDDCESPPDPNCVDFTDTKGDWDEQAGGTWTSSIGFRGFYNAGFNATVLRAFRDVSSDFAEKIVYKFNSAITNVLLYQPSGGFALYYTGTAMTEIEFSAVTFPGSWTDVNLALGLALDYQTTGDVSASLAFVEACIYLVE